MSLSRTGLGAGLLKRGGLQVDAFEGTGTAGNGRGAGGGDSRPGDHLLARLDRDADRPGSGSAQRQRGVAHSRGAAGGRGRDGPGGAPPLAAAGRGRAGRVMSISDEDLAQARNISVEQVRLLRQSRGTTNETLEALPDAALRHSLHRLAYPRRPALRAEFRFRQALGDDGTEPPQQAVETAVTELYVAAVTDPPVQTAGVPTGPAAAAPAAPGEPGLTVAAWQWLGPGNIGGRIRGIVIDPGTPSRMWAASPGGGVWHTQDGGANWATVDDFLGNLACACIAVSRSGVVLAATNTGLFRCDDAARATWTRVLGGAIADVKFDPRDNGRAVAGTAPFTSTGQAQAGAAWFSTDGGRNWTAASHGSAWTGRVELAYAARNPDIVYASVQMTAGAIWRSQDGGASYQSRATRTVRGATPAQYLGDQGWYGNAIWAGDPTDENLVITGGVDLWRSADGGDSLAEISTWQAHPH